MASRAVQWFVASDGSEATYSTQFSQCREYRGESKFTFWEAPAVYDAVSPFRYADQITAPLLLIHGAADNNPGTFTVQSERLFQALQGVGGTARLVLLPHEAHGYAARESVLHVLAEQFAWVDRWVPAGA